LDKALKRSYEQSHIRPALRGFKAASDLWASGLAKAKAGGITRQMLPGDLCVAINLVARSFEGFFSAWVNEPAGQSGTAERRNWYPALQRFITTHGRANQLFDETRAVIGLTDAAAIMALQAQMGVKHGLEDPARFTDVLPKGTAMYNRAHEIPIVKAARELNKVFFSSKSEFKTACDIVRDVTMLARAACGR
jgi:hypothetical protein